MYRSPVWRMGTLFLIGAAVIGLLKFRPWERKSNSLQGTNKTAREHLQVGFLPVT